MAGNRQTISVDYPKILQANSFEIGSGLFRNFPFVEFFFFSAG